MGKANTLVRKASEDDAAAIAELSAQLGYPVAVSEARERISMIVSLDDHAIFVAERNGSGVIGWAHVCAAYRVESGVFAELGGLVVAEDNRAKGVGKLLVKQVEDWAAGNGHSVIRVRSNVVRTATRQFYVHLGYTICKSQTVFRKNLRLPK